MRMQNEIDIADDIRPLVNSCYEGSNAVYCRRVPKYLKYLQAVALGTFLLFSRLEL